MQRARTRAFGVHAESRIQNLDGRWQLGPAPRDVQDSEGAWRFRPSNVCALLPIYIYPHSVMYRVSTT